MQIFLPSISWSHFFAYLLITLKIGWKPSITAIYFSTKLNKFLSMEFRKVRFWLFEISSCCWSSPKNDVFFLVPLSYRKLQFHFDVQMRGNDNINETLRNCWWTEDRYFLVVRIPIFLFLDKGSMSRMFFLDVVLVTSTSFPVYFRRAFSFKNSRLIR